MGGMAFLVLTGSLAGGPLASMTQPPSPAVLMLIVALALGLAHARRRLAGFQHLLEERLKVVPELRRQIVEAENQRDRLSVEALRKQSFETDFAGLVAEMQDAARYREKARRAHAQRRLDLMHLKKENRALRGSMHQARLDLTVLRERIERLVAGRLPTRIARVRSALRAFRASPEILESIRKLEALGTAARTERATPRRERRPISFPPPRIPWRSPGSRAPATRCP